MASTKKVVDRFSLEKVEELLKKGLAVQARFPSVMQRAMNENRSDLKKNEVHNRDLNEVAEDWSSVLQEILVASAPLRSSASDLANEIEYVQRDRSGMLDYDPNSPYSLAHAFAKDDGGLAWRTDPETGHKQPAFDANKLKRWHNANVAWLKFCLARVKKYQRAAR